MRLLVYDRTCKGGNGGNLTHAWALGSKLYKGLRRIDASKGVTSWDEALDWILEQNETIDEIQYWGHGKWGYALVDDDRLDVSSFAPTSGIRRAKLEALAERLSPDALVWFRCCEVFGAHRGIDFAQRLADFLGVRVAGHTYVIGYHQSGLHGLSPGVRADWSPEEGLAEGTADAPVKGLWSKPWSPRTISCLSNTVPADWFTLGT
ncbi:MAG TPA: DUF4347 domain-containing protein [Kofleriaceae bacterium]|jgi:hypothetical protein|nr:DUF4347 domain-containing protein [Kofleriaceae bacterium]